MLIRPKQMNLRELISVKDLLNSRGFSVTSENDTSLLMLPNIKWPSAESNSLFNVFDNTTNRLEIIKLINKEIKEPNNDILKTLIIKDGFKLDRKKYTLTFEWYIGELLVRKFSAFSYAFGVNVNNIIRNSTSTESGDFDVLSVLRNTNLIYIECKSGKAKNIEQGHILKCLERALSLHCEFSIMVIDDIIDEESLVWSLKDIKHPLANVSFLNSIGIKNSDNSKVYEWGNNYFISSKKNIEEQIRTVLRVNEAQKIFDRYTTGICGESYDNLGYEIQEICRC